jgi:hypothetical protein
MDFSKTKAEYWLATKAVHTVTWHKIHYPQIVELNSWRGKRKDKHYVPYSL